MQTLKDVEKIKRHFTRDQLQAELAVEQRVTINDVGFEFNHADGEYWLYSIRAEKATDGTIIGWTPSTLTTYECDSRQEAINDMLDSIYGKAQLQAELTRLNKDEEFEIFVDWVRLEKIENIEEEIKEYPINVCFPVKRVQADWNIPEYAEENSDECEVTLWIKYNSESSYNFHIDFQYDLYPFAQSRANNLPHEDARYDEEGVVGLLKDLRLNRDPYPYFE